MKIPLPSTLTEYYTPDVPWAGSLVPRVPSSRTTTCHAPRPDRAADLPARSDHDGAVGAGCVRPVPVLAEVGPVPLDELALGASLTADQGRGRWGSPADTETATLLRDGKEIFRESEFFGPYIFTVEPDRAEYTLRMTADRSARPAVHPDQRGVDVHLRVHTESTTGVPLLALRFVPGLDDHNAAPAGQRFTIPFFVQRNGPRRAGRGEHAGRRGLLRRRRTWQPAKVSATRRGMTRSTIRRTRSSSRCGPASPIPTGTRSARRSSGPTGHEVGLATVNMQPERRRVAY